MEILTLLHGVAVGVSLGRRKLGEGQDGGAGNVLGEHDVVGGVSAFKMFGQMTVWQWAPRDGRRGY